MSSLIKQIAEKSAIIASNQKTIYDLGFNAGQSGTAVELIHFTVDGVDYVAPKGISWKDYIDSEWNVGFRRKSDISSSHIAAPGESEAVLSKDGEAVSYSLYSKIEDGDIYENSGYIDVGTYRLNDTIVITESMDQPLNFVDVKNNNFYELISVQAATETTAACIYYKYKYGSLVLAHDGTKHIDFIKNQSKQQLVSWKFYKWFTTNYYKYT